MRCLRESGLYDFIKEYYKCLVLLQAQSTTTHISSTFDERSYERSSRHLELLLKLTLQCCLLSDSDELQLIYGQMAEFVQTSLGSKFMIKVAEDYGNHIPIFRVLQSLVELMKYFARFLMVERNSIVSQNMKEIAQKYTEIIGDYFEREPCYSIISYLTWQSQKSMECRLNLSTNEKITEETLPPITQQVDGIIKRLQSTSISNLAEHPWRNSGDLM